MTLGEAAGVPVTICPFSLVITMVWLVTDKSRRSLNCWTASSSVLHSQQLFPSSSAAAGLVVLVAIRGYDGCDAASRFLLAWRHVMGLCGLGFSILTCPFACFAACFSSVFDEMHSWAFELFIVYSLSFRGEWWALRLIFWSIHPNYLFLGLSCQHHQQLCMGQNWGWKCSLVKVWDP